MRIGLKLSLTPGSFTGKELIELYDRYMKFEPYVFFRKSKSAAWNEKKHRKIIEKYDGNDSLGFNDRAGNVVHVGEANKKHSYISFTIIQQKEIFFPSNDDFAYLLDLLPGLISMYFYDADYVEIQSEIFSNNLAHRQWPKEVLDTIKSTPFKAGVHSKEYDVRFNPGREILMDYSWLLAAWKIWLAPPFFVLVPKDKILAFPHAIEIKELPSGVVYVQLFERLEESHTVDSMFRQWKWQEWLDFDSLIKNQDSW